MKLVYCPSCGHVSMKSRLERDTCESCGKTAHAVRVPYPWQYVAGSFIVLSGAVFMVWPEFDPGIPWAAAVATLPMRLAWLLVFLAAGFYFARLGVREMCTSAARIGKAQYPEAEP